MGRGRKTEGRDRGGGEEVEGTRGGGVEKIGPGEGLT